MAHRQKSVFHTLISRPYYGPCKEIYGRVKNCRMFIDQINLTKKIKCHDSCVNTICWGRTGEYILSGSDDFNLCITNPQYTDFSPHHTSIDKIASGHRSNIFSAQFLPNSYDRKIVSCAQDGTIIALDIDMYELYGVSRFNCHASTAYEVATMPDMDSVFMSCSEDKTVRMFDLRETSSCVNEDCHRNIIVKNSHAITTISVNPRNPRQFIVGRADGAGLVYDQRMLSTSSNETPIRHPLHGVVQKFTVPEFKQNYRFTSLCYSPDGAQLLASYSSEYVYLFNIDKSSIVDPDKCLSKHQDHRSEEKGSRPMPRLRVRGDWSDTGPSSRPNVEFQEDVSHASALMQRLASRLVESSSTRSAESQEPIVRGQNSIFIPISALRGEAQTPEHRTENHNNDDDEWNSIDDHLPFFGISDSDIDSYWDTNDYNNQANSTTSQDNAAVIQSSEKKKPEISKETKEKFTRLFSTPLKEAAKKIPTFRPQMQYKGHRNTRTSIKEAKFWGDDYILSGSDCGRVFMWDKNTGKVVLLIPADERVVNCIAPHPYDFVLATSGIEYDIKFWSIQNEVETPLKYPDDMIHSIMLRNEAMLKESRDTITLSPQLFFRLLASLAATRISH